MNINIFFMNIEGQNECREMKIQTLYGSLMGRINRPHYNTDTTNRIINWLPYIKHIKIGSIIRKERDTYIREILISFKDEIGSELSVDSDDVLLYCLMEAEPSLVRINGKVVNRKDIVAWEHPGEYNLTIERLK